MRNRQYGTVVIFGIFVLHAFAVAMIFVVVIPVVISLKVWLEKCQQTGVQA